MSPVEPGPLHLLKVKALPRVQLLCGSPLGDTLLNITHGQHLGVKSLATLSCITSWDDRHGGYMKRLIYTYRHM